MGTEAAKAALAKAMVSPDSVDLVIAATMTPDYISSSIAALIQNQLGIPHAGAFDLQAACTGFLYALATAKAYVESGMHKCILVVASEKMSTYVDYKDRSTCILFGDGASAAIVAASGSGLAIENVCLGSDGSLVELVIVPGGGVRYPASHQSVDAGLHYFKMDGKEVFKHAVRRMTQCARESLAKAGVAEEQVSWLIPHQANMRIMDAVAKGFSLPSDRMYKTVHKYGNTSASSVAIALDELTSAHAIATGEHLLLAAFGAGLTWGAATLTQIDATS
jgi:3-oxoacyl-[acyl-carrier-protein] synthase-3